MRVNWHFTMPPDKDLTDARKRLMTAMGATRDMILILTAEQALKAERVVREAGRKRGS